MCKGHNIIYLSTIIKKQTSLLIVALMFVFCVNLWGCGTETSATLKPVNDMANQNKDKQGNADGAETPLVSLDNETASGQEVVTEQSEGPQQPETTEQTARVSEATSVAEVTSATETTRRVTVICIDPGHGGESQGTHYVYDDKEIEEKNINYYMACKLKSYLEEYPGIKVVIDRGQNEDPDFETRIGFAKENKADYIVSLHVNSKSRDDIEPSGCMAITTRSHYQAEDAVNDDIYTSSGNLATSILQQLNNMGIKYTIDWDANKTGGILRRKGNGTYPDGSSCDYYGLIRNATYAGIPAVIIEHAFLSNESDYRKYLSSNSKLDALAKADCKGIVEYLNGR